MNCKLVLFDCDSTLSAIEGIDELGRVRGEAVFREVEAMTNAAMDGKIPLQSVFGRRLEIIKPSAEQVAAIGARYVETVEPHAKQVVARLKAAGWTVIIVSGGFRQAIRPLADFLGVSRVEAVDFKFHPDGSYAGYDVDFPTTRSGGKPEIVRELRKELKPGFVAMVGDGVSDLETKPEVDLFIGYGGFVAREKVKSASTHFITTLADLPALLPKA
ncbi:MAG: HAD-IB family phosphatase [Opitutaceae bacterium]|nr:HAD-IB family phosphatase [Opitutaceae bacterium]